jgi:protein-S-isoprenylcysteine O-methyltransferase Ste14
MELAFRLFFLIVLVSAFGISGTYRRRARQSGDVIARQDEGKIVLLTRMVFALPLLISLLLYIIYPQGLTWSHIKLPLWLRWIAVGAAVLSVPFLLWVFRNIGRNISETVLTKTDHALVTSGPYRWIRHPLYAGSLWMLFSLGLIASNWFLLLYVTIGLIGFRWLVIPEEEKQLVQAFGDDYRDYQLRTGALFPKLF